MRGFSSKVHTAKPKMDRSGRLLTWITWFLLTGAVTSIEGFWPHHVYREDWKEQSCSNILKRITHRHVQVDKPPQLDGHWTSHRCEIRSGPQFVLRSYTFENFKFESRLYHYEDPDCSKPLFAIVSTGELHLMENSWVVPGATESQHHLRTVHVVPYSPQVADWLLQQLASVCTRFSAVVFKPFRKYVIFRDYWGVKNLSVPTGDDFDCTLPLNFTLNELQIVRVEKRVQHASHPTNRLMESETGKTSPGPHMRVVRELLLGDVHTDLAERQRHRPTSFQEPLKEVETSLCGVCIRINNSHELEPPRLGIHQGTLLSLQGEWVSTRCESRQYGQFLTRWLYFLPDSQSWEGRYDYYHEALCRQPSFTLKAKGTYAGGEESSVITGSKAYSFKTLRLKVTPRDDKTVDMLNSYQGNECGHAGQWRVNQEQDVTQTAGCITLGIRLPSLEQDLMRMEAVHRKLLLFIGQRSSDRPMRPYHAQPPSAFQAPLVKCDAEDLDMNINSLPEGRSHALAMTSVGKFQDGAVVQEAVFLSATARHVAVNFWLGFAFLLQWFTCCI